MLTVRWLNVGNDYISHYMLRLKYKLQASFKRVQWIYFQISTSSALIIEYGKVMEARLTGLFPLSTFIPEGSSEEAIGKRLTHSFKPESLKSV